MLLKEAVNLMSSLVGSCYLWEGGGGGGAALLVFNNYNNDFTSAWCLH